MEARARALARGSSSEPDSTTLLNMGKRQHASHAFYMSCLHVLYPVLRAEVAGLRGLPQRNLRGLLNEEAERLNAEEAEMLNAAQGASRARLLRLVRLPQWVLMRPP